jgi:hypothetical protein
MTLLVALIVLATALNGLLAGASFEVAVVKLPTRRRIGALAYATFARGSDLGNGLWVYPLWAISAALLTMVATLVALIEHQPATIAAPLGIASLMSIGHFLATAQAAPIMLKMKDQSQDEALVTRRLDCFARWHAVRAALQVLTFFILLWTLFVAR